MIDLTPLYFILAIPALFVPVLIATLFAEMNTKRTPVGRWPYATLVGALLVIQLLLGPVPGIIGNLIAAGLCTAVIAYISVGRLASMGIRKTILAVCTGIPLIGIGFMIYLAFAAPQKTETA